MAASAPAASSSTPPSTASRGAETWSESGVTKVCAEVSWFPGPFKVAGTGSLKRWLVGLICIKLILGNYEAWLPLGKRRRRPSVAKSRFKITLTRILRSRLKARGLETGFEPEFPRFTFLIGSIFPDDRQIVPNGPKTVPAFPRPTRAASCDRLCQFQVSGFPER